MMEIYFISLIIFFFLQIEKFTTYILEQDKQRKEEEPCKLSQEEFTFAKE